MEQYADPDPDAVFSLAIGEGELSTDPSASTYAGRYMYMYSERIDASSIRHSFKNIDTRRYDVSVIELPWPA